MNNLENFYFDNWIWESSGRSPLEIPAGKDKVDLSKTNDFWSSIPSGKITRVISVNKNSFVVSNGTPWTSRLSRLAGVVP